MLSNNSFLKIYHLSIFISLAEVMTSCAFFHCNVLYELNTCISSKVIQFLFWGAGGGGGGGSADPKIRNSALLSLNHHYFLNTGPIYTK